MASAWAFRFWAAAILRSSFSNSFCFRSASRDSCLWSWASLFGGGLDFSKASLFWAGRLTDCGVEVGEVVEVIVRYVVRVTKGLETVVGRKDDEG